MFDESDTWSPAYWTREGMIDMPATFVRGMVLDGVYDPVAQVKLVWESGDRSVQLAYFTQPGYLIRLSKEEMIAIAESMQ